MSKVARGLITFVITLGIILAAIIIHFQTKSLNTWTDKEIKLLQSLWIDNLPPIPKDNSNSVADNLLAAEFGHSLFFDTRFSANNAVACATCHQPHRHFTDGLKVAKGNKTGFRNTMSVVGTAYSPWFFWDGRKDSLWSQALSPLETSHEHAGNRMQYAHLISQDEYYKTTYEKLFGPLPDLSNATRFPKDAGPVDHRAWNAAWQKMSSADQQAVTKVFVNIAKSIAAYERLLLPGRSRFDIYIEGISNNDAKKMNTLNYYEVAGLKLFIGKAQCINCHNGPLFTNNEFHNTAVLSSPGQLPSLGRVHGVQTVLEDTFNCLGEFNDNVVKTCNELRFIKTGKELIGTHKTPSLRNVALTAPYMHAGQLDTLTEVIDQYNRAPPAMIGHNETKPINLNKMEMQQIEDFLLSLSGSISADPKWLEEPIQ